MADQGNTARKVVAGSAVVVAACAVAVTVKVLATDVVALQPPRVLDQGALERQVTAEVQALRGEPPRALACPTSVVVVVGAEFTCRYWAGANPGDAKVRIVDEHGRLSIDTAD
ncbi:DUF4333 domain-containing protein [Actinokineospora soli]|uniref:DUF4333 domain-containing protein n=1 Tax=Actinokineospora soli TaxID=1048753 RepID=A0ABW2TZZ5_9PSEU